jgi:hypothetical protein
LHTFSVNPGWPPTAQALQHFRWAVPLVVTMEAFYWALFGVLALIVAGLVATQASSNVVPTSGPLVAAFLKLRNNYVFVYALMMGECVSMQVCWTSYVPGRPTCSNLFEQLLQCRDSRCNMFTLLLNLASAQQGTSCCALGFNLS